ncbi:MAG: antiviral RADAR system adenosine triphosphatase RdrA [Gallionella sp.]|nr:antiviral RADAR system adenosine triphosphatase RdrA [Gallionella sp.]
MCSANVFFPINQREQAIQASADVLLAGDVYQKLAATVQAARELADHASQHSGTSDDVNLHRAHAAVLIDGSRGTGKSSVLVNISKYLSQHHPDLNERVHVLKPLDPTLLETTDDLFLNVIVAGLVCDDAVQVAKEKFPDKANYFHEQLQRLGNTLERLESQRDLRGLDKLRAFMGNQNLAQQVHQVFKAALDLLDRDLLVLPIDDVDTSLNRAFDNLEVIRKYLVSPYVLPVISGDLKLYDNLTWRNFHGRLLKESSEESGDALLRAKDLAREYQRKILPLQYRIEMPEVLTYLKAPWIGFYDTNRRAVPDMTMALFYSWLETILNERTNGTENSYLAPPVKNIRSLAQLVYSLQAEIPRLAAEIYKQPLDAMQLRRQFVIPVSPAAMQTFKNDYDAATRIVDKSQNETARRQAYQQLAKAAEHDAPVHRALQALAADSQNALMKYCQFATEGGATYLTLMAQQYWRTVSQAQTGNDYRSVLSTPLFEPMTHDDSSLRHFEADASTNTWHDMLYERAPEDWLMRLPNSTLLPYPAPEPGYALAKVTERFDDARSEFAAALLLHRNFYTTSKRATLACCGRVFELIVTSLVKDVTADEIAHILQRPPFHSFGAVASTKTQMIATEEDEGMSVDSGDDADILYAEQVDQLALDIAAWRNTHNLKTQMPAPWFFYNVMNKVFNQVAIFNRPQSATSNPDSNVFQYLAALAPKVFNSIWAAIGSFEKGEIFGLPAVIAQVNVGDGKKFQKSELFTRNISPFVGNSTDADKFGKATGAYTYMMATHPLRNLLQDLRVPVKATAKLEDILPTSDSVNVTTHNTLLAYLNLRLKTSYAKFHKKGLMTRLSTHKDRNDIIAHVRAQFPNDKYYNSFLAVIKMLDQSV